MDKKNSIGILLFLIALLIFLAIVATSWFSRGLIEAESKKDWGKLTESEGRLQLRTYLFFRYLNRRGVISNSQWAEEALEATAKSWEEALQADPKDHQLRFALAIVQARLDRPADKTLRQVPPSYTALKTLALDPASDPQLLQNRGIMTFINHNPARRLWLASIYSKLGKRESAERQWLLGYQESSPYAIALIALNIVSWFLLPLTSIFCIVFLVRKRALQRAVTIESSEITADDPDIAPPIVADALEAPTELAEAPLPKEQSMNLAAASECFIIWWLAQIFVGAPFVLVSQLLGLKSLLAFFSLAATGVAAAIAVAWLRLRTHNLIKAGWKLAPFGVFVSVGVALFLLSPVGQGVTVLMQSLTGLKPHEPSLLLVSAAESIPMRIAIILMVCLIVPAAEETIFRGMLYRGLRNQWGPAAGMIISSAIFALGHLDVLSALPLFILAMGLSWSVERTGSILPAVVAHALFNFFPILLLNIMTL